MRSRACFVGIGLLQLTGGHQIHEGMANGIQPISDMGPDTHIQDEPQLSNITENEYDDDMTDGGQDTQSTDEDTWLHQLGRFYHRRR